MRVRFVPRFARGLKGLIALSPGPVAESDTSQGLEAVGWVLWIDPQYRWHLSTCNAQPPDDAPAPDYIDDIDGRDVLGVSLCFNQNGRRVIVVQRGETCTISYIDPGPPETERRINWPGVDPLLFFDGLLRDVASGTPTDVIVFYLAADRRSVKYRLQVESYAVEHAWGYLPEPASLDAIARYQNQVGVWFSTKREPSGAGVLISDPYPFYFIDRLSVSAALVSGSYAETVVIRDPVAESAVLTSALVGGSYNEVVIVRDPVAESAVLTSALVGGSYNEVVIVRDPVAESAILTVGLFGGDYILRSVGGGEYDEAVTLTAGLIGGTYAPA